MKIGGDSLPSPHILFGGQGGSHVFIHRRVRVVPRVKKEVGEKNPV